ncbi:hypothetical protein [Caminibacter pacificus]
MKKLIVMGLSTLTLFALEIKDKVVITKEANPSSIKVILNIDYSQKKMQNAIDSAANNIKVLRPYCQKVTYSINPVYKYKGDVRIFEGYNSHIHAQCTFPHTQTKKFSDVFPKIQGLITIQNLRFALTQKEQEQMDKNLKLQAYLQIQNKQSELSKKLKLHCFAKNIQIKKHYPQMTIMKSLPMPIEKLKQSIEADYTIECF